MSDSTKPEATPEQDEEAGKLPAPERERQNRRATDTPLEELVTSVLEFQERFLYSQLKMLSRDNFWRTMRAAIWAIVIVSVAAVYSMGFNQVYSLMQQAEPEGDYAAFVNIEGPISPDASASAHKVIVSLRNAFKDSKAKGLIIRINSPGGTPVQSAMIHDYIVREKAKYGRAVICVGEDYVASGAYFVASGCDELYVNRSTMAGSIGVKIEGFGMSKLIEQYGVERRIVTNNLAKVRGDMFLPLTEQDSKLLVDRIITPTHEHFIQAVKEGRGDRIKVADEVLFTGDMWTGGEALTMGLVDGLSDLYSVMDEKFGVKYIRNYSSPPNILTQLLGGLSASANEIWTAAETPHLEMMP